MLKWKSIGTILELRRSAPQAKIIAISGGEAVGRIDFVEVANRLGAVRSFPGGADSAGTHALPA